MSVKPFVGPDTAIEILTMHDHGAGIEQIAAAVALPLAVVRDIIVGGEARLAIQPDAPAATRDARLRALIDAARQSPRARVRKLAERLDVLSAEVRAAVAYDQRRQKLRDRLGEIRAEEQQIRRELRPTRNN